MRTQHSKMQLSPVTWNLVAVLAIGATLYQTVSLILVPPSTANRIGFALSGLIAVAASRRAIRTHATYWRNAGHCLVGVLCLMLIAVIVFPMFARSGSRRNRPSPQGNLKQLALGFLQYSQDYDGRLPPMKAQPEMRTALAPYLKSESLWKYTDRNFICINPAVLGHSLSDFEDASDGTRTAVLAFAPQQETLANGLEYRFVAFTNANVRYISEVRFQALLQENERRTTRSNLRTRKKP